MDNPYPITITRDQLIETGACETGIAAFDRVAPIGTLTIPDVSAHAALLSSPLAPFDAWAIDAEIVPPIVVSAGGNGTATAGDGGTATAGDNGTATAGDGGTATAGDCGIITIKWWDRATARHRLLTGYVGEDGIKPNTPYRVEVENSAPRFVEVK